MADRRRINGPVGTTIPPVLIGAQRGTARKQGARSRPPTAIRNMYLKSGVTPSASGSAYLEMETSPKEGVSGMKLSCSVHGPRSLPRSAPFSPHIIMTTHVKFAPFAAKQRRGYLRDSTERDLGMHLESALRGAIIAERWPKSGVDIVVTIIEGDQDRETSQTHGYEAWDMMNVLSGCITVASAALADAGIDCVDTVTGGVAAYACDDDDGGAKSPASLVINPMPAEHGRILSACCVAYLPNRDEITHVWHKGTIEAADINAYTQLVDMAMQACKGAYPVIVGCLDETLKRALQPDEQIASALAT